MSNGRELKLLERGVSVLITNKFRDVICEMEEDAELRATLYFVIGQALGEVLDTIEVPIYWRRFLKRKDCPEYLKEIKTVRVEVYYPKISLPEEEHWTTFSSKSG